MIGRQVDPMHWSVDDGVGVPFTGHGSSRQGRSSHVQLPASVVASENGWQDARW